MIAARDWAGPLGLSVRLPGLILGLVLSILPTPAPAAAPQAIQVGYYGYLGDAPVLEAHVKIRLAPDSHRPSAYEASVELGAMPALRQWLPFRYTAEAEGAAGGAALRPERFSSLVEVWQRRERTALTYGPDGAVRVESDPARRPGAEDDAAGSLDPLSAAVAAILELARTGACGGALPVFDGSRRYDLSLSPVGPDIVTPSRFALYDGPAAECRLDIALRDGFRVADVQSGLYPDTASLWFASVIEGAPAVPVRIVARSAIGAMRLDLVEARLVP